jgi:hypothetical protein
LKYFSKIVPNRKVGTGEVMIHDRFKDKWETWIIDAHWGYMMAFNKTIGD